jgi:hypothetical protein
VADTPTQLELQIRFALSELGQLNAHHDFELICLGFARRRITANLIPATGPVSGGGDQKRDGESYWTNLHIELPDTSLFTATATADKVVLACTIQRDGVANKINQDVQVLGEQEVDRVLYFITGPLKVSKRHELQEWAQDEFSINLDIFDSHAISAELKEYDLFYLAETYLHVPSSMAPDPPSQQLELPLWYTQSRQHWQTRTTPAATHGDLIDLRPIIRHAARNLDARADLPDWLSKADEILMHSSDATLLARTRFEITIAHLYGYNTLAGVLSIVRKYFSSIVDIDDRGVLIDAMILLEMCIGLLPHPQLSPFSREEVYSWQERLKGRVDDLLLDDPFPNARAELLALSARLALHPAYPENLTQSDSLTVNFSDAWDAIEDAVRSGDPIGNFVGDMAMVDRHKAMRDLLELGAALDSAPMFPVRNIANLFNLYVPALIDHPDYLTVRDALDEAVGRVEGQLARGYRAQDRAFALLAARRPVDALHEIHEAKINWWTGDAIEGGIRMLLLASEVYSDLGLAIAAKQCALSALHLASATTDDSLAVFAPRALILASQCDHQAGMWLSAVSTFRYGIYAQAAYAESPGDFDQHAYLSDMSVNVALILRAAQTTFPSYINFIEECLTEVDLLSDINAIVATGSEISPTPADEYAVAADEQGVGRPFSDAGNYRTYTWAGLGISWSVKCENKKNTVLATERFIAALQITLAELSRHDVHITPGRVFIEVRDDRETIQSSGGYCESLPSNASDMWILHLTPTEAIDLDELHQENMATAITVLLERSLLPREQFMAIMETVLGSGLWHKLLGSRPYDELANYENISTYLQLASLPEPDGAGIPLSIQSRSDQLGLVRTTVSGYDHEEAAQRIRNRYQALPAMVQYTLPRLVVNSDFQELVAMLRTEGWLDWHILEAIVNVAGNLKLARSGVSPTPTNQNECMRIMQQDESQPDDALPVEFFTEEALRVQFVIIMRFALEHVGLAPQKRGPDFSGIAQFLRDRSGFWTDDVDHLPLFDPPGQG